MTEKNTVRFQAEIVNGKCPMCTEYTMLVGITREFYRCLTCGGDLQQHINGKITYLPVLHPPEGTKPYVKEWLQMGKRASFGAITKPLRDKPRKRPGRHKKNRNKHEKRMGKYRGKGKKGR